MLGKSVAELDRLTPSEYFLWEQFVIRNPTTEIELKRIQLILAELWATVASFASGFSKHPQTRHPQEVASWLYVDAKKAVTDQTKDTEEEIRARRLQLARRLGGERH